MAHKAIRLEVDEFIDHFFRSRVPPQAFGTPPTQDSDVFDCLAEMKDMKEEDVSRLFVDVVNRLQLAPGLRMSQSEHKPDVFDATQERVDSAFFRSEFCPSDGRPHWADQIVAVEFKRHDTRNDPYTDSEAGTVDADAETRRKVRSQLISYAEKLFEYQHRTALYMFIVIGRTFRITRWDRSGTLVTRRMDYVCNPQVLCDVLWYMSQMTNEVLGFDPSAKRVLRGSAYYTMMNKASFNDISDIDHTERVLEKLPEDGCVYKYVREMFRESLQRNWPRYLLEVPTKDGTRSFLVAKPVFQAPGMAGRGTRGYVALDLKTGRFVWLKDAWRAHYELVDQEGSVLETLNRAGVANVPTLICHGDILGQVTETPKWWELKNPRSDSSSPSQPLPLNATQSIANSSGAAPGSSKIGSSMKAKRSASDMERVDYREDCPLRRHKHYRLVVEEVGMELKKFKRGRQLMKVIYDCVVAHRDAVTKTNIMHRDVSGGNILIFPRPVNDPSLGSMHMMRWGGLLVDWELSKPITQQGVSPQARQPERTGTLQFMSVAMLTENSKVVEIADELESFFHVILYNAVRYLASNCTNAGAFIEDFFDTYKEEDGQLFCGDRKETAIKEKGRILLPSNIPLRFNPPIDGFMDTVLKWFKARYTVYTYRKYQLEGHAERSGPSNPVVVSSEESEPTTQLWDTSLCDAGASSDPDIDPFLDMEPEELQPAKPTDQEEKIAALVDTHAAFLKRLSMAITAAGWKSDGVKGDNVPPSYKPRRRVGPLRHAGIATVKRRRTGLHTWSPPSDDWEDGVATPTPSRIHTAVI
ncbi:hypothetical protein C8Q70DRAFT_1132735 [Cubamyces menziesii]|nr:hypothetical protein C8Q70DRAFT_1132735 [Cubamyces menziesii]